MAMLQISGLTRKYISKVAVNNLSLEIEPGRTYVLLGPNGCGKTTLMKMIAGLTKPTSGEILFKGMAVGPKTKAGIAYMPTESYFYNYMTIQDAGRYYEDFFADFDREKFEETLRRMDLSPRDKISTLSSGMNAKVRLALTLSRSAQLMMFDEPLNGVDILTRAQVISEIIRNREEGRSMIISTHLVDELEEFVDEVIFMRSGQIVRTGSREELQQEGSLTELYLRLYGGFDGDDPTMQTVSERIVRRMEEEAQQRKNAAPEVAPVAGIVPLVNGVPIQQVIPVVNGVMMDRAVPVVNGIPVWRALTEGYGAAAPTPPPQAPAQLPEQEVKPDA